MFVFFLQFQMHVRVERRRNHGHQLQPLGQILHSIHINARQRMQHGIALMTRRVLQ